MIHFSLKSLEFWFNHLYTHEGKTLSLPKSGNISNMLYTFANIQIDISTTSSYFPLFTSFRHYSGALQPLGFPSPVAGGVSAAL